MRSGGGKNPIRKLMTRLGNVMMTAIRLPESFCTRRRQRKLAPPRGREQKAARGRRHVAANGSPLPFRQAISRGQTRTIRARPTPGKGTRVNRRDKMNAARSGS